LILKIFLKEANLQIEILKSKIHRAKVTDKSLNYEGSITIDKKLMEAAGILPNEKVHVFDIANGNRFITYAIEGEENSGDIIVNGAAARLVKKGDSVIIVSFAILNEKEVKKFKPKIVYVDSDNKITKIKR